MIYSVTLEHASTTHLGDNRVDLTFLFDDSYIIIIIIITCVLSGKTLCFTSSISIFYHFAVIFILLFY
jgi:hypothetical protein